MGRRKAVIVPPPLARPKPAPPRVSESAAPGAAPCVGPEAKARPLEGDVKAVGRAPAVPVWAPAPRLAAGRAPPSDVARGPALAPKPPAVPPGRPGGPYTAVRAPRRAVAPLARAPLTVAPTLLISVAMGPRPPARRIMGASIFIPLISAPKPRRVAGLGTEL